MQMHVQIGPERRKVANFYVRRTEEVKSVLMEVKLIWDRRSLARLLGLLSVFGVMQFPFVLCPNLCGCFSG